MHPASLSRRAVECDLDALRAELGQADQTRLSALLLLTFSPDGSRIASASMTAPSASGRGKRRRCRLSRAYTGQGRFRLDDTRRQAHHRGQSRRMARSRLAGTRRDWRADSLPRRGVRPIAGIPREPDATTIEAHRGLPLALRRGRVVEAQHGLRCLLLCADDLACKITLLRISPSLLSTRAKPAGVSNLSEATSPTSRFNRSTWLLVSLIDSASPSIASAIRLTRPCAKSTSRASAELMAQSYHMGRSTVTPPPPPPPLPSRPGSPSLHSPPRLTDRGCGPRPSPRHHGDRAGTAWRSRAPGRSADCRS